MTTYREIHKIIHLFNSKLSGGQKLQFIPDYLIRIVYEELQSKYKKKQQYVTQYKITYSDGQTRTDTFRSTQFDSVYFGQLTDEGIPIELATQLIDEWNKSVKIYCQHEPRKSYKYSLVLEEEK